MLSDELFDTEAGISWASMRSYVSLQYQNMPLYPQHRTAYEEYCTRSLEMITIFEETKQKCFMVVAEGNIGYNGHTDRIYHVFPTCIVSYTKVGDNIHGYMLNLHTLGFHALQCFKLSKISFNTQPHLVLQIFQSFDESIQSELALSKKSIEENCRKEMDDERCAFEKEKHTLRTQLAKYKGIVEDCMKQISDYGL